MTPIARRREAGFTLLELLVVVCVCSIMFASLYDSVRIGMRTRQSQVTSLIVPEEMERAESMMRRLLTNVVSDKRGSQNGGGEDFRLEGRSDVLDIRTKLSWPRYGGRVLTAVHLEVDHNGNLLMLASPQMNVQWRTPLQAKVVTLATGVDHMEFAYWPSPNSTTGAWVGKWSGTSLPTFVRIRLFLKDQHIPRWPDIIVAPGTMAFEPCSNRNVSHHVT
jgi:prepilin-type N-terminal cleavage/methylation domain-containing protein